MSKNIITIIIGFFSIIAYSQNVTISGNSPDYIGDSIVFYTYNDLICKTEIPVAYCNVDKSGNFSFNIQTENTIFIYAYLGIYRAEMYIEPNKNYTITLPAKKEKEGKDILNPYFNYTEVLIGIAESDKNELNTLIRHFDYFYNDYLSINFNKIRQGIDNKLDSFIFGIKRYFKPVDHLYFKNYMKYKLYYLDYLSNHKDYKYITQYFFKNKPILYHNIAYMEFFNNLYKDFFFEFENTKNGKKIKEDIVLAKSPTAIQKTMDLEVAFSDSILNNLIILKGLHDAFIFNVPNLYRYPKAQLNQTLDSMIILSTIPEQKLIAKNIKSKFNDKPLVYGKHLPDITLLNQDSIETKLSSFQDKYVYISLTMTNCVPCQRDMLLIKKYKEKYKRTIEFVTIIINEDFETMTNFIKEHEYDWTFLHYGLKKDIKKILEVEAIPKYILIDPYGRIILPSAPPPGEQFIVAFRKILKNAK